MHSFRQFFGDFAHWVTLFCKPFVNIKRANMVFIFCTDRSAVLKAD